MIAYYLLFFSILPLFLSLGKVFNKKDLNIFDLLILFSTVYFVIIPLYSILQNLTYREDNFTRIFEQHPLTLFVYCLYIYLILLVNIFWSKHRSRRLSVINLTRYFAYIDGSLKPTKALVYLSGVFFLVALYPLINYGALNENNVEGNLTYRYAVGIPLYQRIIITTIYGTLPFFLLVVIKFLMIKSEKGIDKKVAQFIFFIQIVTLLLGTRTFLFFNIILVILYFFSVKRDVFTLKKILLVFALLIFTVKVIFPASLLLRVTKQEQVMNSSRHEFNDVVQRVIEMSPEEMGFMLNKAKDGTNQRSLGVYLALDAAVYKNYSSTNGDIFLDQMYTILPIIKPNPKLENIVAKKIEGSHNDIAESLLTTFYVDLGEYGIILSLTFIFMYVYISRLLADFYFSLFKDRRIYFVLLISVLGFCVNIETWPSIRAIYNPGVIIYFAFGIVLLVHDKFFVRKKYFNFE